MNDLFQSIEEAQQERQAIQLADGIQTTVEELPRCEINTLMRRYCPHDPEGLKAFFVEVEKRRGKESADKLKTDCRVAWAKYRDELAGQP